MKLKREKIDKKIWYILKDPILRYYRDDYQSYRSCL